MKPSFCFNFWLQFPLLFAFDHNEDDEKSLKVVLTSWKPNTERALAELVVHFTSVVGALSCDKMFTPFMTILTQTAKSTVSNT